MAVQRGYCAEALAAGPGGLARGNSAVLGVGGVCGPGGAGKVSAAAARSVRHDAGTFPGWRIALP